jgi:predicted DNA-binding transcriptional regulator AlpA
MLDSFISKREIARRLGVSVSTLDRFIKTTLR